ncbi:ARID DNA-binding domain-containing protein [Syncephalastrum racemosum]|uniref:ARID DNA-binding domain-containing protein n=1 Tax=Syncephalastrum racemosum TaxID=13706 RepID=A0A1X2HNI5_SYNRA|nr:ARID DNA-binding domain-containing protein [Syncephalastrum racemosum]
MAADIERTDEYTNFIRQLNDFHVLKGTTLQAEPILGGKRLDLYRLFKFVVAAGGFEEVTRNRHWKHIGENFNFPPTCTNSAYILKGVYIRNLGGRRRKYGAIHGPLRLNYVVLMPIKHPI